MGSTKGLKIFASIVTAAVAIALVGGFILSGTPGNERLRRMDERRLSHLQQIAYAADAYWKAEGHVPEKLETLTKSRQFSLESINDPQTLEPYEYSVKDAKNYTLCAIFETDTTQVPTVDQFAPYPDSLFWRHPMGRYCFDFNATEINQLMSEKFAAPMQAPAVID
jgi:hypothetical protein